MPLLDVRGDELHDKRLANPALAINGLPLALTVATRVSKI